MSDLRVIVIIPAYNAERTLARAIDSALAQTEPAWEVLVVNDGSRDATADVASRYPAPVRLIDKPNGGAASARNAGLDAARGELVAFLDADDYWEPDKLKRQCELFRRWPDLVLAAGAYYSQEPGADRAPSRLPASIATNERLNLSGGAALRFAMHAWTGVVVARRDAIGEDRFVSGLEPAEDRDFWFRLTLKGPVCFHAEPLATAVLEPSSLSRSNVARDCGNMLRVIDKNRDALPGWVRAKWSSHTRYRWAACDPDLAAAWRQFGRSLWAWPFPYARHDVTMPFARPRLFARLVRQTLMGRPVGVSQGAAS
ncbi:glycosyltransferase family 2 protein [Botrimarina mediterranea]|uniref:Putative glycosyltransferase EpsJ n=1 Tax=Botrimarina mediterranea TaxID=2528022 RepID=A0A518KBE5_9BACT|nr:glycosyltransferase family A protein [Botrimarina mediterranea]QDV75117.1 putative glycosyltransferase EpsJ [Botrimarina mediterranea]